MGFTNLAIAGAGGAAAFGAVAGLANLGVNLGLDRGNLSTADIINMAFDTGQVAGFFARDKVGRWLVEDVGDDVYGAADKNAMAEAVWILVWTIAIIEVVEQLNGFGSPVTGGQFTDGNSKFGAANQTLASADPDTNRWAGDAESGYAALNSLQQTLAGKAATADQDMADILERQAGQVEQVRIGLATTKLGVSVAIPYALYLQAAGLEASEAFQWKVAVAALLTVGGLVAYLLVEASKNANDVQHNVIDKYNGVADAAAKVDLTKELSAIAVPVVAASVVPGVSGPNSSDSSDASGTVVEGDVADQQAQLRTVTGDGGAAGNDTPVERQTPATPPSPPAMPALAQLIAMSGQTTKLFEPGSQRTTQAKAGAPAAQATTAEEAALAEEAEAAGAAPGVAHAEGAPIEVAGVGAQQQQEPTRSG